MLGKLLLMFKKLLADLVQDVIFWGAAPASRNVYSQT